MSKNFNYSAKLECRKLPNYYRPQVSKYFPRMLKIFRYFTGLECQKSSSSLRDSIVENLKIFKRTRETSNILRISKVQILSDVENF